MTKSAVTVSPPANATVTVLLLASVFTYAGASLLVVDLYALCFALIPESISDAGPMNSNGLIVVLLLTSI